MLVLSTLKRQHKEIGEMLANLKHTIENGNLEQEASYIALEISMLAGKLKIHLNTEDQFVYPQLLQSDNAELKKAAQAYMDEMGHISKEFMNYKDRFNTKTKITGNPQDFLKETDRIFGLIERRIEKEDSSLYTFL